MIEYLNIDKYFEINVQKNLHIHEICYKRENKTASFHVGFLAPNQYYPLRPNPMLLNISTLSFDEISCESIIAGMVGCHQNTTKLSR